MHYLCVCIDLALLSCCSMVSNVFSWTPCSAAQQGSGKMASLFTYGNTRMQRNLLRSPRPDSSGCKRGQELRSYVQVTSLSLWGQLSFFPPLFIHTIQGMQRHPPTGSCKHPGVGLTEKKEVGDREAIEMTIRLRLDVIVPRDKIKQAEVLSVGVHSLRSQECQSSVFLSVITDGLLTRAGSDSRAR